MIFGHNPGFTQLANVFLHDRIYNIPTAGVVFLEFEMDYWKEISKAKLVDHFFEYPKKL